MIIRTITFHHEYNFGAMLQAYALIAYLRSLGHDAKAIDYLAPYSPKPKVNFDWVPTKYDFCGVRQLYRFYKKQQNTKEQQRRDVFEEFYKDNIPVTETQYSSFDELKTNPPIADLYIAGSDQIWNTSFPNGTDPAFYLDFESDARKISYAASVATNGIEQEKIPFVKEKLQNFDAISVREQSAQLLLKSLGYDSSLVVDPVFLLDAQQWDIFCDNRHADDKYILVYDFDVGGKKLPELAKRLSRLYKCKIYSVGPFYYKYADKSFVTVGPDAFLSLVKHARCLISNSFHGTAFSIIFRKDFFVVDRRDGLNVRMHDMLERYNLLDRLVDFQTYDEKLLERISYPIDERLNKDIDDSKSFLLRQIQLA